MPDWLLWALAIVLAVVAGWAWSEWRRRNSGPERARRDRPRPQRDRPRPGSAAPRPGRGAGTRAPGRPAAPPRPRAAERAPAGTPRPGEVWWAEVPYADGTGSKVRPCVVLRADGRGVDVLKVTSQDKSNRDDHVRIPTRDWDPGADHDSYLDISEPIRITTSALRDHAGRCDPALWRQLRALPHLPTS
ncbi:PemK-like protein [Micromonospora sp. MW-13]|uniref:type II toxin-antitoxin system PemK/MazF family toxin n=1 Tax=unclassified Micromonospora TaxID=2617518 RepID=UPI000E430E7C|nr:MULTISPECIES: type II toxin-antitoxin system PemK/MazF family toxin [unclassified Micromonospora]MCX4474037.1 type II toxin-antitoxin system PemK/MazF family toxin [Micromonospora sp. NBC_01655]RGC69868.1 PemK-like protein [Micromonospora sp. MW-13]